MGRVGERVMGKEVEFSGHETLDSRLFGRFMQTALVIGRTNATLKHVSLRGQKLLVVQPLLADGQTADGYPLLVVDALGAGPGETVIITSDGRGARELLGTDVTPVRWSTLGIKDE